MVSQRARFGSGGISRRGLLRAASLAAPAIATAAFVGCGDDDDDGAAGGASPGSGTTTTSTTQAGTAISTAKPGDQVTLSETTYFNTTGQKAGGVFRHNAQYSGFTAEPNQAYQGDYIMARLVYNALYGVQWPTYATILYLATKIEATDNLNWTVTLRDGVKWHNKPPINGRAFTAEDVAYSYERAFADKTSLFPNLFQVFVDTVTAVDAKTVKFTAKFPFSSRFDAIPLSMVPKGVIEGLGDLNKRGIGTGPYMFDSDYDPTGVTKFVKNPDFWLKGRPFPDRVEFRHFVDQAAQIAAFRSDQIDWLSRALTKPIADSLSGSDTVTTKEPSLGVPYLIKKDSKPPFNDVRVRQAISLALDRKELLKKVDFGDGAASGPVPWGLGAWALPQKEVDDFYKVDSYQANLAEAKKILEAVGLAALPEFELVAPNDLTTFSEMASLVVSMLQSAGFKVKPNFIPLTSVVRDHLLTGNFEALMIQSGTVEDPWSWLAGFGTVGKVPGANGWAGFSDEKVDSLLLAVQSATDVAGRQAKAHEAQRAIMPTYGGALYLYEANSYFVSHKKLRDFRTSAALSAYDQYDYWLDA